jgi:preprotein translocase subunit SecE
VQLSISQEDLKSLKAAMQNKPRAAVQDPGLIEVSLFLRITLHECILRSPGMLSEECVTVQGILEEVRLISWPNPLQVRTVASVCAGHWDHAVACMEARGCDTVQALSDTFVVIGIVGGTAVTLFFVNSLLADISNRIY